MDMVLGICLDRDGTLRPLRLSPLCEAKEGSSLLAFRRFWLFFCVVVGALDTLYVLEALGAYAIASGTWAPVFLPLLALVARNNYIEIVSFGTKGLARFRRQPQGAVNTV